MVDFLAATLGVAASLASQSSALRAYGARFFSEGVLPVRYQKKNRSNSCGVGQAQVSASLRRAKKLFASLRYFMNNPGQNSNHLTKRIEKYLSPGEAINFYQGVEFFLNAPLRLILRNVK